MIHFVRVIPIGRSAISLAGILAVIRHVAGYTRPLGFGLDFVMSSIMIILLLGVPAFL
jgi:hypothetical protein